MHKFILLLATLLVLTTVALAVPPYPVQVKPVNTDSTPKFSAGLGIGLMYGGLGTNVEYRLNQQASLTAGIGLDGRGEWLLGGRYYFKPEGEGSRGRFTVGVGSINKSKDIIPRHYDEFTKGILAIGWSWANADTDYKGFDIDITTEGRISVGYHF